MNNYKIRFSDGIRRVSQFISFVFIGIKNGIVIWQRGGRLIKKVLAIVFDGECVNIWDHASHDVTPFSGVCNNSPEKGNPSPLVRQLLVLLL